MVIRAHWKGNPADPTEHHHAIPAHDLTDEDYAALDAEHRKTVRESKLYRYVAPATRAQRQAKAGRYAELAESPDDEPVVDDPAAPDDPVTDEPAVAAEEGQGY